MWIALLSQILISRMIYLVTRREDYSAGGPPLFNITVQIQQGETRDAQIGIKPGSLGSKCTIHCAMASPYSYYLTVPDAL